MVEPAVSNSYLDISASAIAEVVGVLGVKGSFQALECCIICSLAGCVHYFRLDKNNKFYIMLAYLYNI